MAKIRGWHLPPSLKSHKFLINVLKLFTKFILTCLYTILAPNGAKDNLAILKNCIPNGIPTIVIHHIIPDSTHESPLNRPPKINHNTFPKKLIIHLPFIKH